MNTLNNIKKSLDYFLKNNRYSDTYGYVEDNPSDKTLVVWLQGEWSDDETHRQLKQYIEETYPELGEGSISSYDSDSVEITFQYNKPKMTNEQLRLQMLSGIITESEYKAKLEESKESLNENFVGMGMVGNIFDREKTDYELAFEHFLGERYEVKPNRERDDIKDINEEEEVEEYNLGHNEIASLEPEGRFWIVSWRGMDGPKEKVFTDEDEARAFMSTLEEGKEVEEPNNY